MLYVEDMIHELVEHPLTGGHYRNSVKLLRVLLHVAKAQAAYAHNVYPGHAKENEWLTVHRQAYNAYKKLTGEDPHDSTKPMQHIKL